MTDLPTEIVSLIVHHVDQRDLYACSLINRQFYAASNSLLWRTVNLKHQQSILRFLDSLENTQHPVGESIRHVDLGFFRWTNQALRLLMDRAPHLETLEMLYAANIINTNIQHLPEKCPKLKSLHLRHTSLTLAFFHALGQNCAQLNKLELDCCHDVPPNAFSVLPTDLPLNELVVSFDADLYNVEDLVPGETLLDLTGLHHLVCLHIEGFPLDRLGVDIRTTATTPTTTLYWPHLTWLSIKADFGLPDELLIPFLQCCNPGLAYLQVADSDLSNVALEAIATLFPGLVRLDMNWNTHPELTSLGIRRLVRHCRQLKWALLAYSGIQMKDFPEAGQRCSVVEIRGETPYTALHHLDQDAMDKIRRGSEPADDDQENNDNGH